MSDSCSWYHWGDIDYGGFSMLARLRREIKNNIHPFCMNLDELAHYKNLTASISTAYIEKLQTLLKRDELSDCFPCINYMIDNKIKLEQEAIILPFVNF
jgi:hypothetical protein